MTHKHRSKGKRKKVVLHQAIVHMPVHVQPPHDESIPVFLTQRFFWKLGVEVTWRQYEKQGEPPLIKHHILHCIHTSNDNCMYVTVCNMQVHCCGQQELLKASVGWLLLHLLFADALLAIASLSSWSNNCK